MSNVYTPPSADMSSSTGEDATYEPKVFSLTGRIGRLRMIAFNMVAMMSLGVFMAVAAGIGGAIFGVLGVILAVVIAIPMVVLSIAFSVRRLNDLNHSGWWVLLSLIPFVSFIYSLYVLFAPGTKGANDFGPAPAENPTWVVVCAWIFPVLFAVGIFAAISSDAYQTYKDRAAGQEQSQSAL